MGDLPNWLVFAKQKSVRQDECLIYTGALIEGYAVVKSYGQSVLLHRLSYKRFNGSLEDNEVVRHQCHNRACWEPAHLLKGSQLDNMKDAVRDNRTAKGEKHGSAILTEAQVIEIKALISSNRMLKTIAKMYGVNRSTISYIKSGGNWKHLKQG